MKNRLWSVLAVATVCGFTACGGDSSSSGVDVSDDADVADVIEEPESSSSKADKKSSSSVAKEDSKKSSSSKAYDKSGKENSADSKNSSSSAKNAKSSSSDEEDVGSSSNTAKSSSSGKDKVESSSSAKKNDSSSSNTKDVSSSSTALSSSSSSSETVVASSSSETPVNTSTSVQTGTYFVDERDDRSYRTVQIGNQIWMAENMKLDVSDGFCYNDTKKNCEKYGVFYTAQTAVRVCPEGWKLPMKDDWNMLAVNIGVVSSSSGNAYVYSDENAVLKLKSETGWDSDNGTDELGFSAFPAGQFDGINYTGFGEKAYFMGSAYSGGDGEYAYITKNSLTATGVKGISSKLAMPVRCMQTLPCNSSNQGEIVSNSICDESKWRFLTLEDLYGECSSENNGEISKDKIYVCDNLKWRKITSLENNLGICLKNSNIEKDSYKCISGNWLFVEMGKMVDSRDDKEYKTVRIGSQTWMAENLNYEMEGSYCLNDDAYSCYDYGRLYSVGAAKSACPSGWALPTAEQYERLFESVGGIAVAGKLLKSSERWHNDYGYAESCNENGDDTFGFSVLPSGSWHLTLGNMDYGNSYSSTGAGFWSSSECEKGSNKDKYPRRVVFSCYGVSYGCDWDSYRLSVRCIKK